MNTSSIPSCPGIYILFVYLPSDVNIMAGRLGETRFRKGHYAYVGSAMGGLKGRINYHLKTDKKPHWHIDYLLAQARVESVLTIETCDRLECAVANLLSRQFNSIPGFGASDCRCASHLFYAAKADNFISVISTVEGVRVTDFE